jgi:5-methylcytosine-specific restriction protein A
MPKLPNRYSTLTQGKQALHVVEANQQRARTYNGSWRKLRKAHLAKQPLCLRCEAEGTLKVAEEVDHIVPVKAAPHRRLDPTNLQSLCKSHHSQKTARENDRRPYDW